MNDIDPNIHDGRALRWFIGVVVLLTAVCGFAALFIIKVPTENRDAMMFALGSVFGWAASVVASEYGSTTTGRKAAESAIRRIERAGNADDGLNSDGRPTGKPGDPVTVEEEK